MGKPRKTGNVLFDIVWAEYPPRHGRKETKAPSRKLFEKLNPSEEEAHDMVEWIKKDKESRESLRKQGKFCKEPMDMIRFLRHSVWEDEINVEATELDHREAHRSNAVCSNNIKSAIEQFKDIVGHRTKAELRKNKGFMYAYKTYPEFREWASKQTFKTDSPTPVKPDITEDLPPPNKVDKIMEFVEDVKQAKADGSIERRVQESRLF
jgi:hypothetical protein